MTEQETNDLAELIAKKLAEKQLTPEEVMRVRNVLNFLSRSSITVCATAIGLFVIGVFAVMVLGIISWVQSHL